MDNKSQKRLKFDDKSVIKVGLDFTKEFSLVAILRANFVVFQV